MSGFGDTKRCCCVACGNMQYTIWVTAQSVTLSSVKVVGEAHNHKFVLDTAGTSPHSSHQKTI